ncbi:MAG: HAD-IC family P-type ATPase [Pseudanabaenaceae cyanobacterium]
MTVIEDQLKAQFLLSGLTDAEVQTRVARGDVNKVALRSSRTYRAIIRENVFTLFHISFGIVLVILAALGQGLDAFFSGFAVAMNIIVGVVQEVRSKWTLDKLALLSVQSVTVIRNGVPLIVPVNEVVRDDLIELKPGDRAPVDGTVVESKAVEMDESLLTGESDPVPKLVGDTILSGSFCLAGSCVFRAEKIGEESYAARISQASRIYKPNFTPLQTKIDTIVKIFLAALVIASFLHIASSLTLSRTVVDTIRYATVIINSFVPAGLVLSISVAFAIGAVEISRKRTLIQKINAVDSMNSVRILCTDKTGTLTQNKLVVQDIVPFESITRDELQELVALYASLVATQNNSARAMAVFAGLPRHPLTKVGETPFSSSRKWGSIHLENGQIVIVGAPEILFTNAQHQEQARDYASRGYRTIAVAVGDSQNLTEPNSLPNPLTAKGLVLLEDGLRPDVVDTIADLQAQGITVKVISGDSVETVASIAQQAGITATPDTLFSQKQLEQMSPLEFQQAALKGRVFGRIVPDMKKKLIHVMVKKGAYVAMVGDGVNDIPAFKAAKLAIAMNDGAQISKDIADIVLLDNNMAALPSAFRAGDQIKQKILVSAKLYLTKNIMAIIAITFVGFVQLPFPIEPRQMTMLTLAVVGVPTMLIALGWLNTKRVNNFVKDVIAYSFIAGTIGSIAMTLGYVLSYFYGMALMPANGMPLIDINEFRELGRSEAQTVSTFIGMIYCLFIFFDSSNMSIWKPSSFRKNPTAGWVGWGMVLGCIIIMLLFPELFQVSMPDKKGWILILFLPCLAHYLLRLLYASPFMRYMERDLSQP